MTARASSGPRLWQHLSDKQLAEQIASAHHAWQNALFARSRRKAGGRYWSLRWESTLRHGTPYPED